MKLTPQAKKIKEEMLSQFLHWAKYNPTIIKQEFGVSSVHSLQSILDIYVFKK
jgi:hypothetical protein